jgi:tetratricopeptide (TPR) repeat protein
MALPRAVIARHVALGVLLLRLATAPAVAVTLGAENERPAPGAGDAYAQGAAAFEREDWQAVVDHMSRAVEERPWHDDAYNLMGFAYRKLGDYMKALDMYDRALQLAPNFPDAIEYRGEAYLALNRIDDAKQAYLTLFAMDRKQADMLMKAMVDWVGRRQSDPAGVDPSAVSAFEAWLKERGTVAQETRLMALDQRHLSWR